MGDNVIKKHNIFSFHFQFLALLYSLLSLVLVLVSNVIASTKSGPQFFQKEKKKVEEFRIPTVTAPVEKIV